MQALLDAVREVLPPAAWSRGVHLCREGRVVFLDPDDLDADEIEAHVAATTGGAAAQVVLYVGDAEWECNCVLAARQPACPHVAAAAICLGHARAGRVPAAGTRPRPARLRYAFVRAPGGLVLRREVVADGTEPEELAVPLAVRQREGSSQLLVQPHDVSIDGLLSGRRSAEPLHATLLQRVLGVLADAPSVTLDGAPVRVEAAGAAFRVRVQAHAGGGARVQAVDPRHLDERFANGAGRFGQVLRPLVAPPLSERDQRALHAGQHFAADEMPALLGEVLPRLARHLEVERVGMGEVVEVAAEVRVQLTVEGGAEAATDGVGARVVAQLVYTAAGPPTDRATRSQDVGQPDELGGPRVVGRVVGAGLRATGRAVPRRDAAAETRAARTLTAATGLSLGTTRPLRGAQDATFVATLRAYAAASAALLLDPHDALSGFRRRGPLQLRWDPQATAGVPSRPGLRTDDVRLNLHDLVFLSEGEGEPSGGRVSAARLDVACVLAAWERGDASLAVPGGGFAPLPGPLLARHIEPLRAFLAARESDAATRRQATPAGPPAPTSAWGLATLGALGEKLGVAVPAAATAVLWALAAPAAGDGADDGATPLPALPPGVTLRPYQRTGIGWLAARAARGIGALLADDMGLGKTLQTLLALDALPGLKLVVVPVSVLTGWAEEAARFCPNARVVRHHGPQRSLQALAGADWVLTSYGVLRLEADALAGLRPAALVLDEAHVIKRRATQVGRAAGTVAAAAGTCVALTGTPLENRPEDLFGLFDVVHPGLLGSEQDFSRAFGRPLAAGEPEAARNLRQRLAPVVLRRLKKEVARDLPPRTDVVLRCELSAEERGVYDALLQATRREVVARLQTDGNVVQALEALLRLRQAACHTGLLPGLGEVRRSSKLELLLDTLGQGVAEGHRALVFSQWTGLLDRIEPLLRAAAIPFARLDGSTRNRGEVVRTFAGEAGPPVLLMSLKAGGVGLNLTAADHVFLLDPWWNPAAEDQAADRANRIGQTRPVLVHRLVATDTVDEAILALQARKRAMAAGVLADEDASGGAENPTTLGREELVSLLGG